MKWTHSEFMSTAAEETSAVVSCDDGWEVFPFGLDRESKGCYATREEAIDAAEAAIGAAFCCSGGAGCG